MKNSQKTKEQNVLFIKFITIAGPRSFLNTIKEFPSVINQVRKYTVSRFPNQRYSRAYQYFCEQQNDKIITKPKLLEEFTNRYFGDLLKSIVKLIKYFSWKPFFKRSYKNR